MLSPDLIQRVDQLFLKSRQKVTDIFSGEFESAFRGRGIEFEEYREYTPGDDVRQIDWNVSARMDKPFIKVFREEREQTIVFMLDASKSHEFGSAKLKKEIIAELAALLAYVTIKTNDKVGLVIFTDDVELYIPPKKGRAHVWSIIAKILTHKPKGKGTNIAKACEFLMSVAKRKTTCFLMSDFWDEKFTPALKVVNSKHDLVIFRVLDPIEKKLPSGALVDFEDLETGQTLSVDLHNTRQVYQQDDILRNQENALTQEIQKANIDYLNILTNEDHVELLLQFFLRREKKR